MRRCQGGDYLGSYNHKVGCFEKIRTVSRIDVQNRSNVGCRVLFSHSIRTLDNRHLVGTSLFSAQIFLAEYYFPIIAASASAFNIRAVFASFINREVPSSDEHHPRAIAENRAESRGSNSGSKSWL